jgi:hypothetical protein
MFTAAFLTKSLALWKRREAFRKDQHDKAEKALDAARAADVHPRDALVKRRDKWAKKLAEARLMVERRTKQLLAIGPQLMHPHAKHVPMNDAGAFVTGKPRIVHHTTEGTSISGAEDTYRIKNSAPHFTFDHDHNELHQHIPINRAARALEHRRGFPETNRAHAIQIEHVGIAAHSQEWSKTALERIAELCRWIEANAGVERRCTVSFANGTPRLAGQAWFDYRGHLGHMHVPGNSHTDPGRLNIQLVL